MTNEREKKSKAAGAGRGKTNASNGKAKAARPKSAAVKPQPKAAKASTAASAKRSGAKSTPQSKSSSTDRAKSGASAAAAKESAKVAPKTTVKSVKPLPTQRPGLRFGSRDKPLSPLSLTPPPPPPPTKSPSRGKGITIIEPKRQAMKAALEAEKATKSKRGTPKLDLANARSVAAVAMTTKADAQGYVVVNGRRVRVISSKESGFKAKKKKKVVPAPTPASTLPSEQTILTTKTKLPKADLDHYRDILLQHRRELVNRVTGLEDEALRSNGGNLSNMPLHPADIGTDTFDQDFALGMAATDRLLLQEIDDAIDRIEQRTYGVCQMTGKPIPKTRLDAKPWAKFTVEAARLVESGAIR